MNLPSFVQMLYPFLSEGKEAADFLICLFEVTIQEDSTDLCSALDLSREYAGRVYNGKKPLPIKAAAYLTSHLDEKKLKNYFKEKITEAAASRISAQLKNAGIECKETIFAVSVECTKTWHDILIARASGKEEMTEPKDSRTTISDSIDEINRLLGRLPKPEGVTPPEVIIEEESVYVRELMNAYSEHEQTDGCVSLDTINQYPDYKDDLETRRTDYFAAESIRRGVAELPGDQLQTQFDVLKDEMLTGVRSTCMRSHPDGYERMMSVMDRALDVPLEQYLLGKSSFWISNHIRMGVCHFLVNDKKLKWVKK